MTTRVVMICHGATEATKRAAFPADEPLLRPPDPVTERADLAFSGPATRCRQTAEALGLKVTVDERLRECDYGRWTGRTLTEVSETEPAAVHEWLTDPAAVPHGGESTVELVERAASWLDSLPSGRIVAVTHPSVIKAVIVHAIHANPESFWRIDIAPLSRTVMSGPPWKLSVGAPPARRGSALAG
jgi:broad specificity phosphatase PhoE